MGNLLYQRGKPWFHTIPYVRCIQVIAINVEMTIVGPYLRVFPLVYIFTYSNPLLQYAITTIRAFGQAKYLARRQYLEPRCCQPFPKGGPYLIKAGNRGLLPASTTYSNQRVSALWFIVSYYTLRLVYGRHQKSGVLTPSPHSHLCSSEHTRHISHINCSTIVEVHDNTVQSNHAGYFSNSLYLRHFAICPWIEFNSRSFSCFRGSNCFIQQSAKCSSIKYIAIAILHSRSNDHNSIIKTFNVL
jgi:hypothetical protein